MGVSLSFRYVIAKIYFSLVNIFLGFHQIIAWEQQDSVFSFLIIEESYADAQEFSSVKILVLALLFPFSLVL